MSLNFLQETTVGSFRRLERDLTTINPKINMAKFKAMSLNGLTEAIASIDRYEKKVKTNNGYGAWLKSDRFMESKLLREALELLHEHKEEKYNNEVLIPNYVYYRGVQQYGDLLTGYRCMYLGEGHSPQAWVPFETQSSIAKALEVMSYGTTEDFQEIYVRMANGTPDALSHISLKHITESSKSALRQIERYCDSRWAGKWSWEQSTSYKLKTNIQETRKMNIKSIAGMQSAFKKLVVQLHESELGKVDLLTMANDMMTQVDSMISSLGKISSGGIEAVAAARASVGEEAANSLQTAITDPVNQAASALTDLKSSITQAIQDIDNADTDMMDGGMDGGMGDDMGSPEDMMGDEMSMGHDDDMVDAMSDVSLGGDPEERPKKEL